MTSDPIVINFVDYLSSSSFIYLYAGFRYRQWQRPYNSWNYL